nr:MAG TPA: hypothetical protein [Caudoviricetes sp.]
MWGVCQGGRAGRPHFFFLAYHCGTFGGCYDYC